MTIKVPRDTSSEEYPWEAWADLIKACVIVPRNIPDLLDLWKSNDAMLKWAEKVQPKLYEDVKAAFTKRKIELQKGEI